MDELMLLTDGSVNTLSNIGYGAYLAVSERGLSLDSLRTRVKVRRFEHTSSTKLDIRYRIKKMILIDFLHLWIELQGMRWGR